MKYYVLVSQGIEIFRTTCKEEAEKIMNESNKQYYEYYADTEVFMYEEEVISRG